MNNTMDSILQQFAITSNNLEINDIYVETNIENIYYRIFIESNGNQYRIEHNTGERIPDNHFYNMVNAYHCTSILHNGRYEPIRNDWNDGNLIEYYVPNNTVIENK